jgi:Tol biopolymer transport system component
MKRFAWTILTLALLLKGLAAQDLERQFKAAVNTETVDRNCKAAIEQYRQVAAGSNRPLAAQALLRMADCYQRLGDVQAQQIYQRLITEFRDQRDAAAVARARLGTTSSGNRDAGIVTRQLWTGPKVGLRAGGTPSWTQGGVSADGRYLSFVDWSTDGDLALHDFTTGEDRRLTYTARANSETEYAQQSTISRDGKRIAYGWWKGDRTELRLLDLNHPDAKPRALITFADSGHWIAPFDWSPDGKSLVVLASSGRTVQIGVVSTADGVLRVLKSTTYDVQLPKNAFSPDGKYVAYSMKPSADSDQSDVYILALDGDRDTPVVVSSANDVALGWTPDGKHLLFTSDRSGANGVWAISLVDGKAQGGPSLVKGDLNPQSMGLTQSGALYYSVTLARQDVYVASYDFAANKQVSAPAALAQTYVGFNDFPAWSYDGKFVAYLSHRDPFTVLVIRTIETGKARELRLDLGPEVGMPLWSRDNSFLLVSGYDRDGRWGIYRVDLRDGAISPLVINAPGEAQVYKADGWSPDGATLYLSRRQGRTFIVLARDLATGHEREIVRRTVDGVAVSPRGRFVALTERSPNGASLLVVPVEGGQPRTVLHVDAPENMGVVTWSADEAFLIFARQYPERGVTQREFVSIPVEGGTPRTLEMAGAFSSVAGYSLRVHPDGRQLAFNTLAQPKSEIWVMDHFLPAVQSAR